MELSLFIYLFIYVLVIYQFVLKLRFLLMEAVESWVVLILEWPWDSIILWVDVELGAFFDLKFQLF